MSRSSDREFLERLRVETAGQTSRRAFLGKLGKAAAAVSLGGVISGVSSARVEAAAYSSIINVPPYATLAPQGGDVTDALNWFISVALDGGLIQFPAFDRYQVDGTVRVDWKSNLTLEFNGSTLWTTVSTPYNDPSTDRTRSHLRINSCDTVHVNDLTIVGPKPLGEGYNSALEAQAGIEVQSSAHVHVVDYNCSCVWGDGLYAAGRGDSGAQPSHISMSYFQIADTGRDGTATTNVDTLTIFEGVYSAIGRTTFDMEPNNDTEVIENVWMHDVTIMDHQLNFVSSVGIGTVDGVTIESITAVGDDVGCAFGASTGAVRNNIVLQNMTSDTSIGDPAGAVMPFVNCENIQVAGIDEPLQVRVPPMPPMTIARFWNCTAPFTVDGAQMVNETTTPPF